MKNAVDAKVERHRQMLALRELVERRDPRNSKRIGAMAAPALPADRPISFNDEMMRALLAGTKTETRRPVSAEVHSVRRMKNLIRLFDRAGKEMICPLATAGGRLWVRERWAKQVGTADAYLYAADQLHESNGRTMIRWRPTFHMPRAASRLLLTVHSVHPQRLDQITSRAARAEGFPESSGKKPREWFRALWDQIYKTAPLRWQDNPWVWVIKFRRCDD